MLLGYGAAGAAGGNAPPQLASPPSKRAKVEMRSAPKLSSSASADLVKGQIQVLFGLNSLPADCDSKLHRAVDDRKQSWAFGDERSLTYLLSCYKRLCASEAKAASDIAAATTLAQVQTVEEACFPRRAPAPRASDLHLGGSSR